MHHCKVLDLTNPHLALQGSRDLHNDAVACGELAIHTPYLGDCLLEVKFQNLLVDILWQGSTIWAMAIKKVLFCATS